MHNKQFIKITFHLAGQTGDCNALHIPAGTMPLRLPAELSMLSFFLVL